MFCLHCLICLSLMLSLPVHDTPSALLIEVEAGSQYFVSWTELWYFRRTMTDSPLLMHLNPDIQTHDFRVLGRLWNLILTWKNIDPNSVFQLGAKMLFSWGIVKWREHQLLYNGLTFQQSMVPKLDSGKLMSSDRSPAFSGFWTQSKPRSQICLGHL